MRPDGRVLMQGPEILKKLIYQLLGVSWIALVCLDRPDDLPVDSCIVDRVESDQIWQFELHGYLDTHRSGLPSGRRL